MSSVHAEDSVMRKFFRKNKFKRVITMNETIDILVVRLTKTGQWGYSRPCHDCILKMTRSLYKINTVYYTDHDGNIISEKINNMYRSPLTKFSNGRIVRAIKKRASGNVKEFIKEYMNKFSNIETFYNSLTNNKQYNKMSKSKKLKLKPYS